MQHFPAVSVPRPDAYSLVEQASGLSQEQYGDGSLENGVAQVPAQETEGSELILPLSRIKRMIKADSDVKAVTSEAAYAISRAAELFIEELAAGANCHMQAEGRTIMYYQDVANAVKASAQLAFLADIVPQTVLAATLIQQWQQQQAQQQHQQQAAGQTAPPQQSHAPLQQHAYGQTPAVQGQAPMYQPQQQQQYPQYRPAQVQAQTQPAFIQQPHKPLSQQQPGYQSQQKQHAGSVGLPVGAVPSYQFPQQQQPPQQNQAGAARMPPAQQPQQSQAQQPLPQGQQYAWQQQLRPVAQQQYGAAAQPGYRAGLGGMPQGIAGLTQAGQAQQPRPGMTPAQMGYGVASVRPQAAAPFQQQSSQPQPQQQQPSGAHNLLAVPHAYQQTQSMTQPRPQAGYQLPYQQAGTAVQSVPQQPRTHWAPGQQQSTSGPSTSSQTPASQAPPQDVQP